MDYKYIGENLNEVRENIKNVSSSMENRPDVTLISVTKTYSAEIINEAVKCGVQDIGENKVQEIMSKYDDVKGDVRWHLIGHLQTNKVKYIIDKVHMIHSVDSLKLATEISKRAKAIDTNMNILVQVNIASEDSKFGITEKEVEELILEVSKLENLNVKGLMMIAPFIDDEETLKEYFTKMKFIFDTIAKKGYNNVEMKYLSMGMTNDYELAIKNGSNMVRVGTGIFGKRIYK